MRRATRYLLLLLLWLAAGGAQASGISSPLVGSTWSSVTTGDAAAIHYNPAMLATLEEIELQLGGALVWANIGYQREYRAAYQYEDNFKFALPLAPSDIDPYKSGLAEPITTDVFMPLGAAFFAYRPIPDLTTGIGIYAPYGAALDPPDDGPQRYAVQQALLTALFITPALAYRVTDWLYIGGGFNLVIGMVNIRQVVDLASTPLLADALADPPLSQRNDFGSDAPPGVRELEVLSRPATLETTAVGASFNAGITIKPHDRWTLAVAYQHGADLVFTGPARLDMSHDFFTQDLAFKGLRYPALVEATAYIQYPLPPSLRAGVEWQIDDTMAVSLQASCVLWSVMRTLRVTLESADLAQPDLGIGRVVDLNLPRQFLDVIEVEALFGYRFTADLRAGARLGYHSPAAPDHTLDLSSIDGHRIIAVLMADYRLTETMVLTGHLGMQHMITRTVVASRQDTGNGTYSLTILNAGASLSFLWE